MGPAPYHPGWYWVNKDVMCPRLTNSDGYVNIFIDANKLTLWLKCNFKALHEQNWTNLTEMFNMLDHTDNSECKLSTDTVFDTVLIG